MVGSILCHSYEFLIESFKSRQIEWIIGRMGLPEIFAKGPLEFHVFRV